MSALDFGGTAHTNPTPRYYTASFPQLPDSDWAIVVWIRATTQPADGTQWPSILFSLDAGFRSYHYRVAANKYASPELRLNGNSGASGTGLLLSGYSEQDILHVWQRRGTAFEEYYVNEGVSVSVPSATQGFTGTTLDAQTWYIGCTPSITEGWFNPLGEIAVFTGTSFTAAEVTTIAAGARAPGTPVVLLPFREGAVATEPNLGSGGSSNDATRVSTGFETGTDFFDISQPSAKAGVDTHNEAFYKYTTGFAS